MQRPVIETQRMRDVAGRFSSGLGFAVESKASADSPTTTTNQNEKEHF
jgi:hypothetical protein